MRTLIVSFDKSLTRQLKEALEDHEVIDVKNGEEALNLATHYFDIVIYDAISGAISEEDINHMYEQKFKDSKFIIMTDDLFPINVNNLKPHKKVIIPRETAVKEILSAIEQPVEVTFEQVQPPVPELEIEMYTPINQEPQETAEASYLEEAEDIYTLLEQPLYQEDTTQYTSKDLTGKERIAIVSFDGTLIDSITSLLPKDVEITPVKSFRNLEEILKDQNLVVFDAISGLTAKKRLIELSKDPAISTKPFIILIDELFSIDVEDIPLDEKYPISRAESPEKIVEQIMEILTSKEIKPTPTEEISPMQILGELIQEKAEQRSSEEVLESTMSIESYEQPQEEVLLKEEMSQVEEMFKPEEKAEYLPSTPIEEIEVKEELIPEKKEEYTPPILAEGVQEIISKSIKELGPLDEIVRNAVKEVLESKLESIVKEEIRKAIETVPLENIIREIAYQVLKEKLNELIT